MGGRGDVAGEEGFVSEEQKRNKSFWTALEGLDNVSINSPFGDFATRRLDLKVDASWTWAGGRALTGEERVGNLGHFF